MIIYNVTLKVNSEIAGQWTTWMQQEHIPELMATGLFTKYNFCRLLEQDEKDGLTFVAQYFLASKAHFDQYLKLYAEGLRQKGLDKFGDKVLGFRTLMETIA